MNIEKVAELLGQESDYLLGFDAPKVNKQQLHIPGPDWIERIFVASDRPNPVLRNMQLLFNTGRLAGTGYLSILPVDQGIEHSAGASFAPNPMYFDSENIVKLAIEAGCNGVAATLGVLEGLDAFRRPDRLDGFLGACEADWRGWPAREPSGYPQAGIVRRAFEAGAAVRPVTDGQIPGDQIGRRLRQDRLAAIRAAMPGRDQPK